MIICGMLFAERRDVARVALILDTIAFATILVVYKLACYNYYVCFCLQESRDLSRRLTVASLWIAPLSIGTVLTARHGQRGWSEDLALSITLLLVAAVIRPMIMLFQPVSSRRETSSWLLREWKKLFFASVIGSSLMVSAALLFNERGVARLDIVWDNAIYLLLTTAIALSHNKAYQARLIAHRTGVPAENKERLLIVGVGIELSAYISALPALPEQHFEVIGVVTPNRKERSNMVGGFPILGGIKDAPAIVKYSRITRVVVVGRRGDKATFQYLREKCSLAKEQVLQVEILNPVLRRWRRVAGSVVPPMSAVTSRSEPP
jgi:FlaA1/EpsC-like NDP-sugar epimerase